MQGRLYTHIYNDADNKLLTSVNMSVQLKKEDKLRLRSGTDISELQVVRTSLLITPASDTTILEVYTIPAL